MGIAKRAQAIRADLKRRRARLPWAELEAEARRQRCSHADIFFDWAGRMPERDLTTPRARLDQGDKRHWTPSANAEACSQSGGRHGSD